MSPNRSPIPLIGTKLHRPPVALDAVRRDHLCARLDQGRQLPLTLVSAPAGYGKSTLVGQWLEALGEKSAWLSLDEADDDPLVFLSYLVAAIRTTSPDACPGTLALLKKQVLPSEQRLIAHLVNDLDAIEDPFVLALDDYHSIRNPAIHQVISGLLNHPPESLHLAILSRRDPPIPIALLRGRNRLTEVRARDLQFSREESGIFLERATGRKIDESSVDLLHAGTEGWPVGLRLTALALRDREDVEGFVRGFGGGTAQIQQFLMEEILSRQSPDIATRLCETSILDRFCASVVEAVCSGGAGEGGERLSGEGFLQAIKASGLPCAALDDQGLWYRHHHLFQELLRRRLRETRTPAEVSHLHRKAAAWFEEAGLLEEALGQALRAGDAIEAGRIIARRGRAVMHGEQWHRLSSLLGRIPAEVVEGDVRLLLLKAWVLDNRMQRPEAWKVVDRAQALLEQSSMDTQEAEVAWGEIYALRSCQRLDEAQGALAVEHAERALGTLPPELVSERGYSMITLALGHQVTGQADRARRTLRDALADAHGSAGIQRSRLLSALAWIQWLEGDLHPIKTAAKEYIRQARAVGLAQSLDGGHAFLGVAHYQLNELEEAEEALGPLVSDHSLEFGTQVFLQGGFALACTYQASGRPDKAHTTANRVEEGMVRLRNAVFLQHARAFKAELALRQGRLEEAVRWAEGFEPEPFGLIYRFYAPEITLAKVLIAEGTRDSHRRAESYLQRLTAFLSRTHCRIFSIPALALHALLRSRLGDEAGALQLLDRSVDLARPGGAVRVFADLDQEIGLLLGRLHLDVEGAGYVERVLAAFKGSAAPGGAPERRMHGVDALTRRQMEVLELLAQRLSNKEIARQVRISAGTVKRHTEDIYRKLGVHGRREAVAEAERLGILREPS